MQKNVYVFLFHRTYLSIEEGKITSVFGMMEDFLEEVPCELDHERCIMIPASGILFREICIISGTPKYFLENKE